MTVTISRPISIHDCKKQQDLEIHLHVDMVLDARHPYKVVNCLSPLAILTPIEGKPDEFEVMIELREVLDTGEWITGLRPIEEACEWVQKVYPHLFE